MISNLKVDIIYYKTSSDFELEFNLSGCCRMRIFKDKVNDRKELVNTLARDVSRSRVIIVVTDLIGEKNGVEIVSSAIGYKYEPIDKMAHSIKSGDNIKAPHGCLPLVTKAGQYGGCIVECGKQSIIIVSSDRSLRHEVMRTYIHQYIFDINQVEAYNERLRHESEHNPIIDQSNILNTARQEFMPATAEIQPASENTDIDTDAKNEESHTTEMPSADENSEAAVSEETTSKAEEIKEQNNDDTLNPNNDSEATDDEVRAESTVVRSSSAGFVAMMSDKEDMQDTVYNNADVDRRLPRRKKGTDIALLVVVILLLVCFGLLAYYFVYLPIVGGELPNDLTKILSEVLPWTE